MKKEKIKLVSSLILVAITLSLFSCKPKEDIMAKNKRLIVGSWEIFKVVDTPEGKDAIVTEVDKKSFLHSIITFYADGKMKDVASVDDKALEGTYTVSDKDITVNVNNANIKYNIITLTESDAVFEIPYSFNLPTTPPETVKGKTVNYYRKVKA